MAALEEKAEAGQKHESKHESPDAKRRKTDDNNKDNGNGEQKDSHETKDKAKEAVPKKESGNEPEDNAVKPGEQPDVPHSIMEKGIIYFFIRGRVNIDSPEKVDDVARSYMLLRPMAPDAKLGEGPIGDAGTTRLLALPKKVLPLSGRDRFMTFVEKTGASFEDLKKEFLDSTDYETKTAGTRHTPAATPVGEGVYAMTTTGRESHLAYITTLPEELGEAQKELGIQSRGSFIVSTKNPNYSGPANTNLPEGPEFPKEIIDEFRSLRWLASKSEHFDYPNAQILLIGESSGLQKAMEPQKEDQKEDKKEPEEVLESLEEEDLQRMRHLADGESDSIYADLQAQAEGYPKLQTTF